MYSILCGQIYSLKRVVYPSAYVIHNFDIYQTMKNWYGMCMYRVNINATEFKKKRHQLAFFYQI